MPAWQMVFAVLALYFIPLFQPFKFFFPFLVFFFSAYFLPHDTWNGLLLTASFFLLLGIKNLEFLNRRTAYQSFVLLLIFSEYFFAFRQLGNWGNFWAFAILAVPAAVFFFLARGASELICGVEAKADKRLRVAVWGVAAFLIWQIAIIMLFLPLNPAHQVALLFLWAAILFQSGIDHFCGNLNNPKLVFRLILFCALAFAVILGAGRGL